MRKLVIFLYFVFLFKLAFAESLPTLPGFGDLNSIEPSAGTAMAQTAQVPPPPESESDALPFDPNQLSDIDKKDQAQPGNSAPADSSAQGSPSISQPPVPQVDVPSMQAPQATAASVPAPTVPQTQADSKEFDVPALPESSETGTAVTLDSPEVKDIPKLPDQPTQAQANPANAVPANHSADAQKLAAQPQLPPTDLNKNSDTKEIEKIISDDSVRDQFPKTPSLDINDRKVTQKSDEIQSPAAAPLSSQDREKEVNNLLDQVFDKQKTPKQIEAEKVEAEKEKKAMEKEKAAQQDDHTPLITNIVDVNDKPVKSIDSLKTDDDEQQDLSELPASMRDPSKKTEAMTNFVGNGNHPVYTSSTYSEQQLSNLLVSSAMKGDKADVIQLISSGRNPNSQNIYGESALMGAIYNGHNDIAEVLLSEGANPNLADNKGDTSLLVAAARNNLQAVQQLIKSGAEVDAANNASDTPLLVAVLNNNTNVADALVRQGANINKPNADGLTALHIAAYNGNSALAKYLLSVGANPNVVARGGFKPYDLAKNKNPETAQIIESYVQNQQKLADAERKANEIKLNNSLPAVQSNNAQPDQYALYPKAYIEQQKRASQAGDIRASQNGWWASSASMAKQPDQNETNQIAGNNSAPSISAVNSSANSPVLERADYSNYGPGTSMPASLAQANVSAENTEKKWTKLTVDPQSVKTEEHVENKQTSIPLQQAPQQNIGLATNNGTNGIKNYSNYNSPAISNPVSTARASYTSEASLPNTQLTKAVYDNNGNIINSASVGTTVSSAPVANNAVAYTPIAIAQPQNQQLQQVRQNQVAQNIAPQPVASITPDLKEAGFVPVTAVPLANFQSANVPAPSTLAAPQGQIPASMSNRLTNNAVSAPAALIPAASAPVVMQPAPRISEQQAGQQFANIVPQQAPISSKININVPKYSDLEPAKQAVWDMKLEQWVKAGMNINSQGIDQQNFWMKQQMVLQAVYQEQFNAKVETAKRKLSGSVLSSSPVVTQFGNTTTQSWPAKTNVGSSFKTSSLGYNAGSASSVSN